MSGDDYLTVPALLCWFAGFARVGFAGVCRVAAVGAFVRVCALSLVVCCVWS